MTKRRGGNRRNGLAEAVYRPSSSLSFEPLRKFVLFSFVLRLSFLFSSFLIFFCAFLLVFIRKRDEIRSLSMKLEIFFFFNLSDS